MSEGRWALKHDGPTWTISGDHERVEALSPGEVAVPLEDLLVAVRRMERHSDVYSSVQLNESARTLRALLPPEEEPEANPVPPLCPDGHKMRWVDAMGTRVWLSCPDRECMWRGPARANKSVALKDWNRRAAPEADR